MASLPDPDEALFLTAPCPSCARVALGVLSRDGAAQPVWCCIHCDQPLDLSQSAQSTLSALDEMGYDVGAPQVQRAQHGGCRGGQCGVRQPRRS